MHTLDSALISSAAGHALRRAVEVEACIEVGLSLGLDDVTPADVRIMRMIREERNAYQREREVRESDRGAEFEE